MTNRGGLRFTLYDLLHVGAAEPTLLPKTLRTLTLLDTPDVLTDDPLFIETLAAVRVEHATKLAERKSAGYTPPIQRADLLLAGLV
ncbi:MAG: hypothetical protein IH940_12590 [Acidobacteria bacterium]|nr:hypothetical protein [Acidobacteriota bacterium]